MAEITDEEFRKYLENPPTLDKEIQDANIGGFDITEAPLDPLAVYRALRPQPTGKEPGSLQPPQQVPSVSGMTSPDTLGGRIMRKAPQIAGGTIGGAIGAVIPSLGEEGALAAGGSALGNYLLGPMFAAAGGAAGRMATLSPDDPQYSKKMLNAALEEGLSEFGGRALSAGLGRGLRYFRGSVEPGAEAADTVLRTSGRQTRTLPKTIRGKVGLSINRRFVNAKELVGNTPGGPGRIADEFGAHLLPGQSTESIMDTIQGLSEGSFVSGGKLRRFRKQQIPTALNNATRQLQESVRTNLIETLGPKKASAILANISNADAEAIQTIEKGLYEAVDKLNKAPGDIRAIKMFADSELGKGLKPGARERMLRMASKKPDMQTFEELRVLRRDARQEQQKFLRADANVDARVAGQLAEKIDETMEQIAKSKGPDVYSAFRTADAFHRGRLRTEWLENTIVKTTQADEAPGNAFVKTITKMSKGVNNRPSELARMGFNADEIDRIVGVANAIHFARKQAEGGGRMLIQLAQGGAIVQIGGGLVAAGGMAADNNYVTGTGVAVMLLPELAARMMLSPTGAKMLSTGIRMPVGSRTVGTFSTRLLREAAYHAMKLKEEGRPGGLVFLRRDPVTKQEMAMREVPNKVKQQSTSGMAQQSAF